MLNRKTPKICLIGESLANGGAEKAMALLSQFFHSKGIGVHNVIVLDQITYDYSGQLLNLGKMKNTANGPLNKLKRFLALRKFLRQHRFDFIIDFRVRVSFLQEYFISKVLYNAPTIYTVHSAMTDLYFPKNKKCAHLVYKNAFAVVAVSDVVAEIIRKKYGLDNVSTMHNPIDIRNIEKWADAFVPAEEHYILAAGRMNDDVKQFDKLIAAYANSGLPAQDISLVILGDGSNLPTLKKLAMRSGVEAQIVFKGRVDNPFPYMKHAKFFVLSSRREGLPTVILESLACGKPVVSFDCVSGPSEMIAHERNGLLVTDQDFNALTEAMNRMASDEKLYTACCEGAKPSVQSFSLENIGRQWLEFLKINVS
ncbi:Glycosyltransferase family 4 protein [Flavobacterium longum]|uniref:glycosyltransferase n=1 Tax=Flavobacterium longum TaxID=1299340 RepID=UPI0039E93CF3